MTRQAGRLKMSCVARLRIDDWSVTVSLSVAEKIQALQTASDDSNAAAAIAGRGFLAGQDDW